MNTIFEGRTAAQVWEKSIHELLALYSTQKIKRIPTEHNNTSIELTGVLLKVEDVMAKHESSLYHDPNFLEGYENQLLDQEKRGTVYTRITALNKKPDINQEEAVVESLKKNWFSRRAVINICDPYCDIGVSYPPCVCAMQFLIRDEKLQLSTFFRSNDAWKLALPDMLAFMKYQKRIAIRLGISASIYTQFVGSYHIYDYDIMEAKTAFEIGGAYER